MTCPSQGNLPCSHWLNPWLRTVPVLLDGLKNSTITRLKRRASIRSSKVIDLEEQDLIRLTSVVSKGFKVPLDVGVSPFIIPGCKSFLTNFDTPMGNTPQCKPASLCGYLSTTSIHLGRISYTCSDGMEIPSSIMLGGELQPMETRLHTWLNRPYWHIS